MEILHIKDLSFKYEGTQDNVLSNLDFSLNEGDFTVIFGETGCGKSTLLKLIKKEIAPYGSKSGSIIFDNRDVEKWDDSLNGLIGFVGQNPNNQIVTDTVWHEICFGLQNMGLQQDVIRRRVAETSSYFGIEKLFSKKTCQLSGGEKQLLNLASVVAMQPKLLLLDEPTSQLDPITGAEFINTLKKLNDELGLTVLIAEHRLQEAFSICNNALLMEKGKIIYNGSPKNLGEFYKNNKNHPSYYSIPTPIRVFTELNGKGSSPLTVREGRRFIKENYGNDIKRIEVKENTCSKEKAVSVENVYFRYEKDGADVINDLSLSVYKGEHYCLLGGNGAGKTTLLNILSGVKKHYRGKILINDKNIKAYKGNSLNRNNLSYLMQNPESLFFKDTVAEELEATAQLLGYSRKDLTEEIDRLTEKLRLKDILKRHPYDLSGGEQQKTAVAKILLSNPNIILLDEPTKGLDGMSKENLWSLLSLLKSEGVTLITVTHDIEFAAAHGDSFGLLFDGQIVSEGRSREFFTQNSFYTTAGYRITRDYYENAVLCDDVVALCSLNGG